MKDLDRGRDSQADQSLLLRVAVLAGVLAFLGVAQGCGSGKECFRVAIDTTDQSEWTEEGKAFCKARGFPGLGLMTGHDTRIEEICCRTRGINIV